MLQTIPMVKNEETVFLINKKHNKVSKNSHDSKALS